MPDGSTLQRVSELFEISISQLCGYNDTVADTKNRRAQIDSFLSTLDGHDRRRVISTVAYWEKNLLN